MTGTITAMNPGRGMVAVKTDGGYSIFELTGGDEFEIGDKVSWQDDTALGSEYIMNHTRREQVEVFFQNHYVPPDQLRAQLLFS